MFIGILQGTPAWVWGALGALVGAGLWQTRARAMSLVRVSILPLLLIGLSFVGVVRTFGAHAVALGAWTLGVASALTLARDAVAVRGARWSSATGMLLVPGSWLPLALIVALFAVKYFAGASLAIHPALAGDATFTGLCCAAYGAFGGLFLARGWSLRRLATRQPAWQAA